PRIRPTPGRSPACWPPGSAPDSGLLRNRDNRGVAVVCARGTGPRAGRRRQVVAVSSALANIALGLITSVVGGAFAVAVPAGRPAEAGPVPARPGSVAQPGE